MSLTSVACALCTPVTYINAIVFKLSVARVGHHICKMAIHELALDHQVRDWVFIPLTISILLMKLLTQYAHMVRKIKALSLCDYRAVQFNTMFAIVQLMHNPAGNTSKETKEIKEQQAVTRSQRLRATYRVIPESSYKMRKEYFAAKVFGQFVHVLHERATLAATSTMHALPIYHAPAWTSRSDA